MPASPRYANACSTPLYWEIHNSNCNHQILHSPFLENKERGDNDEEKADGVVPFDVVTEIKNGKHGEDDKGDDFLNCFEVAVPGEGHKHIRNSQKNDGGHVGEVLLVC